MIKGHQENFEGEGQVHHDCDNCGTGIYISQDLSNCTIIIPQSSCFIKVFVHNNKVTFDKVSFVEKKSII